MTTDLWMLAAAVGLAWVQIVIAAAPVILADMGWAHGLVYMAVIPGVRTALWLLSVVGMGMIASSLF